MTDAPQHRDFDAEFPVKEVEQISFRLGGREFLTKKYLHPQTFVIAERGVAAAVEIIRRCLDTESRTGFEEMMADPDSYISSEQLDEAGSWVLRHLSGASDRPTSSPSPSGAGQEVTPLTSVDAPS